MACNQRYPTNIENSSTQNTRPIGYFTKSINGIIWTLNVWTSHKHQLQTAVGYISAQQLDVRYILYEITDNDL